MTTRGFRGLYDKCATRIREPYYQTGLRRVHLWSDEVIQEDIDSVRDRCPDLDETYEACFVDYVTERFRGGGQGRPTVQCPPILSFMRRFLETISQSDQLTTGEFFSGRDPILRRIACMDAGRSAMYGVVSADTMRVELASEIGATKEEEEYRSSSPPPSSEIDVHPNDSVSQVGSVRSVRVQPRYPSPVPSAASRHTEPEATPASPVRSSVSRYTEPRTPPPPPPENMPVISTKAQRHRERAESVASQHGGDPRHDFIMREEEEEEPVKRPRNSPQHSVASLRTRSVAGSNTSSVSIGMKRMKSPRH